MALCGKITDSEKGRPGDYAGLCNKLFIITIRGNEINKLVILFKQEV